MVECELAARVDVRDDGAVIERDEVAERDKVRLRHKPRTAACPDRAVLADSGSHRAVEPDDIRGAGDGTEHPAVAVTAVEEAGQREVELPALA